MIVLALLAAASVLLWPARRDLAALGGPARGSGPAHSPAAQQDGPMVRARGFAVVRGRPSLRTPGTDEIAELVEVLVPPLRSGASTAKAVELAAHVLASSAGLGGLTAELSQLARAGEPLAEVWGRAARRSGSDDLRMLARAWALSEETGVPLAAGLATVARNLRVRQSAMRALAAATAGARASMVLLALLPATGPAIGMLFGLTPMDLYGRSPVSGVSLLAGAALGVTGLMWSRAILRRAVRPAVVS